MAETAPRDYLPIADYALIGDMHSCALVSKAGAIDWCCFPRFDSPSVFGRILDRKRGGHLLLAPEGVQRVRRRYRGESMILETIFETEAGRARLVDFMPLKSGSQPDDPSTTDPHRQIVRLLECERGSVHFRLCCRPRFEYGTITPRARVLDDHHAWFEGGADALSAYCSAGLQLVGPEASASGVLREGDRVWAAATHELPRAGVRTPLDDASLDDRLQATESFWQAWSSLGDYDGRDRDRVVRSALTLKALSYAPSGALVAAATTSLPETIGGTRNWDYRFTWIRDATFALYALSIIGHHSEGRAFKGWLEGATHGDAAELQVVYGVDGKRQLPESTLDELDGYAGSRPVRVGNRAHRQFQLDVYGELLDSAHLYRKFAGELDPEYWDFLQTVVAFVIGHWREPDEGIWEVRGGPRHFVYSKVMSWVALDRAIRAAEALRLPADLDLWRRTRETIREDVLAKGYDPGRETFVQSYGGGALDSSALLLPLVGFIAPNDPRMRSTVSAVRRDLSAPNGLLRRYRTPDGIPGGEGVFVPCTLWLADNLAMQGEVDAARSLFKRVSECANDVGLLSEEIEPEGRALLGNFPQALSHLALISTAVNLDRAERGAARA